MQTRLLCPPLSLWVCSNSCPLSWWCYLTFSFSVSPFSFYLQSFPASGSFPVNQLVLSGSRSIGTSASAVGLPVNIQGLISFSIGWFVLLEIQGYSQQSSAPQFKVWWSSSHMHTWLLEKLRLTTSIFVVKVISLLFNTLSRLVIAFLPRSKRLLISWLQSTYAVILEPKKRKCVTVWDPPYPPWQENPRISGANMSFRISDLWSKSISVITTWIISGESQNLSELSLHLLGDNVMLGELILTTWMKGPSQVVQW